MIAVRTLRVSGFAPWYFPFPNMATWDKQLAVQSARRLLEVGAKRICSGHGAVHTGGTNALRAAVEQAERG